MPGTLIISLDFELFWGMLDKCELKQYEENVLGGRKAIPELLKLFEKYGIHATWATVGFLFAENGEELKSYFPEDTLRPGYADPAVTPYPWFDGLGENEQEAPCFYGPSLVRLVAQTPGQEIGSHTFCHYYCREAGQTAEQFAADLRAARAIAEAKGYCLRSIVLPRNQCNPEYLSILRDSGFTAYRDLENDWIHRKVSVRLLRRAFTLLDAYLPLTSGCFRPRKEAGMWNLTGSKMYRPIMPSLRPLEKMKLCRIKGQMRRAARKGLTYHLWWHPHNLGVETQAHLAQLEELFRYYGELKEKYGMQSLNMGEAAED